jgi:cell wall-associated NlpC family hydrolase
MAFKTPAFKPPISRLDKKVVTLVLGLLLVSLVPGCTSSRGGNRGGSPKVVPLSPGVQSQPAKPAEPTAPQYQRPVSPSRPVPPSVWKEEADKWMGTQYRSGGMDHRGIDCSGLTWQIYRAVAGVTLPHNAAKQFAVGIPVAPDTLRAGDLVFFGTEGSITHVGVFLGGGQFVHASTHQGVIVTSMKDPYYARRFFGAKRVVP